MKFWEILKKNDWNSLIVFINVFFGGGGGDLLLFMVVCENDVFKYEKYFNNLLYLFGCSCVINLIG